MKQKEINLSKLFNSLKLHVKQIIIFSLGVTLIAVIYCIFATPIFTAKVLINPPKLNMAGNNVDKSLGDVSGLDFGYSWSLTKTDADVVIAILNTDQLRDLIVNKFNLMRLNHLKSMSEAREMLSGITSFDTNLKSGFLSINVDSPNPKLATEIANYYIIALGQVISNIAYNKTLQRQDFFSQQVEKTRNNLHKAQADLKDFSLKNGVSSGQQLTIVTNLVTQLQAQLVVSKSQLLAMSLYATPDNPDYKNLQATVNSLEKQIDSVNGQSNGNNDLPTPANLTPELAMEYQNLERNIMLNEEILKLLFRQYENTKIEGYSQIIPTAIEVVDPALVPEHKSKPKRLKIVMATFLMSLFFGMVYYLFRDRKNFILEV